LWKDHDSRVCSIFYQQINFESFAILTGSAQGAIKETKVSILKEENDYKLGNKGIIHFLEISLQGYYVLNRKNEILHCRFFEKGFIICGDNKSHLHLFVRSSNLEKFVSNNFLSFLFQNKPIFYCKAHEKDRISVLKVYGNKIYSIGKDRKLKTFEIIGKN
jgi:hypothetical protein